MLAQKKREEVFAAANGKGVCAYWKTQREDDPVLDFGNYLLPEHSKASRDSENYVQ